VGDIFAGAECAQQEYTIKLPNSAILVDIPFFVLVYLKSTIQKGDFRL
jgi:hypothetical protein